MVTYDPAVDHDADAVCRVLERVAVVECDVPVLADFQRSNSSVDTKDSANRGTLVPRFAESGVHELVVGRTHQREFL